MIFPLLLYSKKGKVFWDAFICIDFVYHIFCAQAVRTGEEPSKWLERFLED